MSRGPDAHTLLARALAAAAAGADVDCAIATSDWTRWASATFTGARHVLALAGPRSAALDDWLTALPDREFTLAGHLVADLTIAAMAVTPETITATLEVLTVEDR